MTHIDLSTLLSGAAPGERPRLEKALGGLGDSLEDAVRGFVHEKAREVTGSDAFATVWTEANRTVHASVDKALTGSGGGAVRVEDDAVTLDLAPVVEQVKQRLVDGGMGFAARIPEVHTDFTLVRSDDIGKVKSGVRLLQILGDWLPVLAVLLVAGGALVAAALAAYVFWPHPTGRVVLGLALALLLALALVEFPAAEAPADAPPPEPAAPPT
ncbi:hypothetical protein ACFUIZ_09665 [Streptomyces cinereoruber]|uniref:hypothetical protein n=1 Tax=Streptomyces cinereoruber TaxID=67260 RepID=UPI0036315E2C